MPPPEDENRQNRADDIPAKDPVPGERAEADLRQDRRQHHEPELEQEKRQRRADDQAGLSRRRVYEADCDHPIRHAQQVVQRGDIEDVAVLDVSELMRDRGDQLGVVERLGELEVYDQVRRVWLNCDPENF